MAEDTIVRLPDAIERYSNNVKFEASDWDLKLVFGVLDQSTSPLTIRQHTTMNVSWAQAKLMAFYVAANVLLHENTHGKIHLQKAVMPPRASDAVPDSYKDTPEGREILEKLEDLYSRLL